MAVDHSAVGRRFGPYRAKVSRERLAFFAKATGETRPVYLDATAARAAGWRDIPAPPSFPFCLQFLDTPEPLAFFEQIGVDLRFILHADQAFEYRAPICAGDEIALDLLITDITDRKDGALTFITDETTATNQFGEVVAIVRRTGVVRNR